MDCSRRVSADDQDALFDYLFDLEFHGIRLGLENISFLLNAVDNPQHAYPSAHIAGTNGKGSVAAFLDAILRRAGYTTGRFTSPHLIDLNERFLIDAIPVSDADMAGQIRRLREAAKGLEGYPTFFEMCAAMAFGIFACAKVDAAVIEVGMGGRFDATNVLRPTATAVTNISLEHTQYLGDTLAEIAGEKAGIIKPDTPVVVGEIEPSPCQVILRKAKEMGAPALLRDRDFHFEVEGTTMEPRLRYDGPRFKFENVQLGMAGRHQGDNAAVATAMAEILVQQFPAITCETVKAGLHEARWPCRLERVLDAPPVIIDVAHNAAGALELAEVMGRCILVLAVSADKDTAGMLQAFDGCTEEPILTQFDGHRALPLDELCAIANPRPYHRVDSLTSAIDMGLEMASQSLPLVITGSIFTAGEARRILVAQHGAPPLRF